MTPNGWALMSVAAAVLLLGLATAISPGWWRTPPQRRNRP